MSGSIKSADRALYEAGVESLRTLNRMRDMVYAHIAAKRCFCVR